LYPVQSVIQREPEFKGSTSLAAGLSRPGMSWVHMVKQCAVGGESLANFALDHVSLENQLRSTCEPGRAEDEFCILGGIQVGQV